jgi:hypothetical protein
MPVHNEPTEVFAAREKRLSDPKQVMRVLLIQRSCWMYTSMDKEALAVVVKEGQGTKPISMREWKIEWGCGPVAIKCRSSRALERIERRHRNKIAARHIKRFTLAFANISGLTNYPQPPWPSPPLKNEGASIERQLLAQSRHS